MLENADHSWERMILVQLRSFYVQWMAQNTEERLRVMLKVILKVILIYKGHTEVSVQQQIQIFITGQVPLLSKFSFLLCDGSYVVTPINASLKLRHCSHNILTNLIQLIKIMWKWRKSVMLRRIYSYVYFKYQIPTCFSFCFLPIDDQIKISQNICWEMK